jgi:GT2 family glycosyltransferase
MMKKPNISVIVVNLNTRDLLRDCLGSVFQDDSVSGVEVILIDNGSTDGSVEMVRRDFPQVQVQVNGYNERFAKPNNDGMRKSGGKYLFFLNSDAAISRGTLRAMTSFMDAHSEAGACGPMLEYPDGRLQRSVSKFHTLWTHVCDMLFLDILFPHTWLFGGGEMMTCPYDPTKTQAVQTLMGAAFMVREEVLTRTGMFDEHLTVFYNEMDWFRRMKQDGWTVYYVPITKVVHHRGVTSESMNRDFKYLEEMYYNVFYYFRKYYGVWGLGVYRFWLLIGFTVRWAVWRVRATRDKSDSLKAHMTYIRKVLAIAVRIWIPIDAYRPVL